MAVLESHPRPARARAGAAGPGPNLDASKRIDARMAGKSSLRGNTDELYGPRGAIANRLAASRRRARPPPPPAPRPNLPPPPPPPEEPRLVLVAPQHALPAPQESLGR